MRETLRKMRGRNRTLTLDNDVIHGDIIPLWNMNFDPWIHMDAFWSSLTSLFSQLQRHFHADNIDLAERFLCRIDAALELLRVVYARVEDVTRAAGLDIHSGPIEMGVLLDLVVIMQLLQRYGIRYAQVCSQTDYTPNADVNFRQPDVYHSGQRGRPPFLISFEQLEALIDLGLNLRRISQILGVSERTIQRRREIYGLPIGRDRYSALSDVQLDEVISSIMQVLYYLSLYIHSMGTLPPASFVLNDAQDIGRVVSLRARLYIVHHNCANISSATLPIFPSCSCDKCHT